MTGGDRSNYGRNLSRAVLSTALGRAKFMKDRSNMRTGGTNPIVYWTDGSCLRAKWNGHASRLRAEKERGSDKEGKRESGRESGDSILYFFRTRFPVTGNLGYTTPHRTARCRFPRRSRRRPKLYSVCREFGRRARSLARLRFFRLLLAEVFHEDCGVPGRNLKWMPVSAPRYSIGDFLPFLFSSPLSLSLPFVLFSPGTQPFSLPALPKFVLANYFLALSERRKFGTRRSCPFISFSRTPFPDIELSLLNRRDSILEYHFTICLCT